jgi:hypothetical protein
VDGIPIKEWIEDHDEDDPFREFTGPEYQYSQEFMCRLAADATDIPWTVFKLLPYYERSGIVAYHRAKGELDWVRNKKAQIKAARNRRRK